MARSFSLRSGLAVLLLLLLAVAQARFVERDGGGGGDAPVNHPGLIRRINEVLRPSWVARAHSRFAGMSLAQAKGLCGYRPMPEDHPAWARKAHPFFKPGTSAKAIPASFDAREQWASCADVIGHIRDQSNCGSCWAFASTEAFNDRVCIASNGSFTKILSVQQTASCCNLWSLCLSFGCKGGNPFQAYEYFLQTGLVTGGDASAVGKGDSCYPYEVPPCHNHSDPKCKELAKTPKCRSPECPEKGYPTSWEDDLTKSSGVHLMQGKGLEQLIQRALLEGGPVTVAMEVYADFMTYSSGVYRHVTGEKLGGHAVKIIGWGGEVPTSAGSDPAYWLVVNSWGAEWGEHGLFRIARGTDECGIESTQVTAADVVM